MNDNDIQPKVNPWLIALTVMLPTFMEVLDTTIANVSLTPHRRQPVGFHRRIHLGADELSDFQRDRHSLQRVARDSGLAGKIF